MAAIPPRRAGALPKRLAGGREPRGAHAGPAALSCNAASSGKGLSRAPTRMYGQWMLSGFMFVCRPWTPFQTHDRLVDRVAVSGTIMRQRSARL